MDVVGAVVDVVCKEDCTKGGVLGIGVCRCNGKDVGNGKRVLFAFGFVFVIGW